MRLPGILAAALLAPPSLASRGRHAGDDIFFLDGFVQSYSKTVSMAPGPDGRLHSYTRETETSRSRDGRLRTVVRECRDGQCDARRIADPWAARHLLARRRPAPTSVGDLMAGPFARPPSMLSFGFGGLPAWEAQLPRGTYEALRRQPVDSVTRTVDVLENHGKRQRRERVTRCHDGHCTTELVRPSLTGAQEPYDDEHFAARRPTPPLAGKPRAVRAAPPQGRAGAARPSGSGAAGHVMPRRVHFADEAALEGRRAATRRPAAQRSAATPDDLARTLQDLAYFAAHRRAAAQSEDATRPRPGMARAVGARPAAVQRPQVGSRHAAQPPRSLAERPAATALKATDRLEERPAARGPQVAHRRSAPAPRGVDGRPIAAKPPPVAPRAAVAGRAAAEAPPRRPVEAVQARPSAPKVARPRPLSAEEVAELTSRGFVDARPRDDGRLRFDGRLHFGDGVLAASKFLPATPEEDEQEEEESEEKKPPASPRAPSEGSGASSSDFTPRASNTAARAEAPTSPTTSEAAAAATAAAAVRDSPAASPMASTETAHADGKAAEGEKAAASSASPRNSGAEPVVVEDVHSDSENDGEGDGHDDDGTVMTLFDEPASPATGVRRVQALADERRLKVGRAGAGGHGLVEEDAHRLAAAAPAAAAPAAPAATPAPAVVAGGAETAAAAEVSPGDKAAGGGALKAAGEILPGDEAAGGDAPGAPER